MVKKTERGWAGHFCAAKLCLFRRNTLLEKDGLYVVVSTVGNYIMGDNVEEIGIDRYFETKAFYSLNDDYKYHDADVSRQIYFNSEWAIDKPGLDSEANNMHESVVDEITSLIEAGQL